MRTDVPYKIHHIKLDQNFSKFPSFNFISEGNYCVFWWEDIALGHCYIEPGKYIPYEELLVLMINSVQKTLQFYNKGKSNTFSWEEFKQNDTPWYEAVKNIFTDFDGHKIPDSVPISVIICTRNRAAQLERCLLMVNRLTCKPKEILVIDNGSEGKATFDVVNKFKDAKYIWEPTPGLDNARNTGIKSANMPIVFFLDDDVVIHPLCLWSTWHNFETTDADAMTGLIIALSLQTEAQLIFEKFWSFNRGYTDIWYDKSFLTTNKKGVPRVWDIGAGANMAFKKSIFNQIGFFDPRLDVGAAGCSGDSEIWYRMLLNGLKILYNPRAIAFHDHRKEMEELNKQLYYYMRGHAAAALIQHSMSPNLNYRDHVFQKIPKYYWGLFKNGFPHYPGRFQTLKNEIKGFISGILFYSKIK